MTFDGEMANGTQVTHINCIDLWQSGSDIPAYVGTEIKEEASSVVAIAIAIVPLP